MTKKGQQPQARCCGCGDKYTQRFGANNNPVACSLLCAELILRRLITACERIGWDWKDLLPAERPDLVPWDAWQAVARLRGKAHWRGVGGT